MSGGGGERGTLLLLLVLFALRWHWYIVRKRAVGTCAATYSAQSVSRSALLLAAFGMRRRQAAMPPPFPALPALVALVAPGPGGEVACGTPCRRVYVCNMDNAIIIQSCPRFFD